MFVRKMKVLLALSMVFAAPGNAAQSIVSSKTDFAREAIEQVYQPAFERFSQAGKQFLDAAQSACQRPSPESLAELRTRFKKTVATFSAIELYRMGPMLEDNRQNRLFYWPDKRRAGERQLRELLSDSAALQLTAADVAGKSVTLQGLPALERLLYGKSAMQNLATPSHAPDCQVVTAIADNLRNMAVAINHDWRDDSELVQSMISPEPGSDYFRSNDEVLRSLVTQIIVAIDVVLDRKIASLTDEDTHLQQAPMWRSGQTLSMIRSNLNSIRALSVDTGLASVGELDNELEFEFRNVDQILQKLEDLPVLTTEKGSLTHEAQSLLRTLTAIVSSIKYTLNDRFTAALGISAGFNSEDGD